MDGEYWLCHKVLVSPSNALEIGPSLPLCRILLIITGEAEIRCRDDAVILIVCQFDFIDQTIETVSSRASDVFDRDV